MCDTDDNLSRQVDEIEALSSIYGDSVQTSDSSSLDVIISEASLTVKLHVIFPPEYPSTSPPVYQLSAPFLRGLDKSELCGLLEDIYLENVGESIVFLWVERIREFIVEWKERNAAVVTPETDDDVVEKLEEQLVLREPTIPCPSILTGDCIEDRKSIFQGHFAQVSCAEEVKKVLDKLYENRKIAHATHNMFAYRIKQKDGKSFLQDCDDDGETNAGSRMLHLLEIVGAEDVLVVVSRWYGGIHLGPDRFKHINNAARMVLEKGGAIDVKKKSEGNKKKN